MVNFFRIAIEHDHLWLIYLLNIVISCIAMLAMLAMLHFEVSLPHNFHNQSVARCFFLGSPPQVSRSSAATAFASQPSGPVCSPHFMATYGNKQPETVVNGGEWWCMVVTIDLPQQRGC